MPARPASRLDRFGQLRFRELSLGVVLTGWLEPSSPDLQRRNIGVRVVIMKLLPGWLTWLFGRQTFLRVRLSDAIGTHPVGRAAQLIPPKPEGLPAT